MAAATGTDPKAGRRRTVVDKDLVPNLSLRLFMPEIRHRPNSQAVHPGKNIPPTLRVKQLPCW